MPEQPVPGLPDQEFTHATLLDRLLLAPRWMVLAGVGLLIGILVATEWTINLEYSLGILYVIPVMLGSVVLNRKQVCVLAPFCAFARGLFTEAPTPLESALRFGMATLAYCGTGMFVVELRRNRQMYVAHLAQIEKQQSLRREAEEQLRVLVESSPAAIMTLDEAGCVLAANRAALEMLDMDARENLIGQSIAPYIPLFVDALKLDGRSRDFRTAAQCWGRRQDGSAFMAQTWFSTYEAGHGKRLAAIAVDTSEEVRNREEQHWNQLLSNNRVLAGAVSHEIRNLCAAIRVVSSNLHRVAALAENADFQALESLVKGLHNLASFDLKTKAAEALASIDIAEVLGRFHIIAGPSWDASEGLLEIDLTASIPRVLADPHELLQVLLNLSQNSLRAVQDCPERWVRVRVMVKRSTVVILFQDSGPGISNASALFQPFQRDADASGLGLYVSRALVRSFQGELRHVPSPRGACFEIELAAATIQDEGGYE